MLQITNGWILLKDAYSRWSEHKAWRLAAALSFYTVFSMAPMLVIAIAIAGLFFGQEAAAGQVQRQIESLVGKPAADAIETTIRSASSFDSGIAAAVTGVVTLLFGASGVFAELQDGLNTVWEVMSKPGRGVVGMIKDRFASFAMIFAIAFILLVSLAVSAALAAIDEYAGSVLPSVAGLLHALNFAVSFAVITLLFAMIYKVLPDVRISWRDVWIGAAMTSLLFTIGKSLIGLYLGRNAVASAYGAAGSIVIILLWVYYSSQIVFFGAELTRVYANRYGSHILPAPNSLVGKVSDSSVPVGPATRLRHVS